MKLITRYIARNVLIMTVIVSVAFIGMGFFVALANQFHDIGKGDYTLARAMWYVLLITPHDFYQVFPIAGLLGSLLALGLLANHSELTVLRAAGMSVQQIMLSVVIVVVGMVALVTILGEVYAPKMLNYADTMRALDKNHGQAVATQHGIWLREKNDFIHIGEVSRKGGLSDISRFNFDTENHLQNMVWAEKASYHRGVWSLTNVHQSAFSANHVTTENVANAKWRIRISPSLLKTAQHEPEEMDLRKLYQVMRYKRGNNLEYIDYALPFWQRVLQPLATCVMILLAIPFVFGPLRHVSMGLRIFAGLGVGFSFYLLNQCFVPFSTVFQIPPFFAAITPTVVFLFLGLFLLRRVK